MISIPGREPTWTLSPLLLQHVLKAVPARPHICAFRACKCTVSILQRNVRKSPPTAAAAIWRPTVGHARGESYVPPTTLSRLAKAVSSLLLGVSLPRYSRLRKTAHRVSVPVRAGRQVFRAGRAGSRERHATMHSWGDHLCASRKASEQVCKVANVCTFHPSPARRSLLPLSHCRLVCSTVLDSLQRGDESVLGRCGLREWLNERITMA